MSEEQAIIKTILEWHAIARREGLLALSEHVDSAPGQFARQAIGLLVEDASPQMLRANLGVEALLEAVLKAMVIEGAAGHRRCQECARDRGDAVTLGGGALSVNAIIDSLVRRKTQARIIQWLLPLPMPHEQQNPSHYPPGTN